ncbi:MAG: hypothetical protein ACT4P1_02265 [Sporichthyaceae bacterium]
MTEVNAQSGSATVESAEHAVTAVMDCETHEGYRVEHREWEEIDWEADLSATPAEALQSYLAEDEDLELVAMLRFHPITEGPDVTEYVAALADGTIHGVVTAISGGDPVRWAVSHVALCTLDIVPEEEPETYEPDGDDDVFEH